MASFTIVSEGSPIIPYNLNVSIDVNHTATYVDPVTTGLPYPSQDFTDFFDIYAANTENTVKNQPEFTTQDTNRNATWSVVFKGVNADDSSKNDYDITQVFTIENAVAEVPQTTQTDLTGSELTAHLQAAADSKEAEYFAVRPWVAL